MLNIKEVSGQLPAEENCLPPGLVLGFRIRLGLVLGLGGATRQLPQRKIAPWLGLALFWGGLGGQFSSGVILLEH